MEPDPVKGHPTPGMHIWGWMAPEELDWLGTQAATMSSVGGGDFPGVAAAVDELFPGRFTVAPDTSIWAVRL